MEMGKAFNIPVNQKAPVCSAAKIRIQAPPGLVWEYLTTLEQWPSWQESVSKVLVEGPVGEGTEFRWKAGGLSFRSRIHTSQPKSSFGWTGKTIGANAIHNWHLEGDQDHTIVTVEESLDGILPTLFPRFFQKNLDAGIKKNLEELRQVAEKV